MTLFSPFGGGVSVVSTLRSSSARSPRALKTVADPGVSRLLPDPYGKSVMKS
jgi:hypothetical protein